jgi:transglutaminase-like putative cysteine protease
MNLLRPSRALSAVATAPLVAICLCLLLAAAPLFPHVAGWAVALLVVAAAARLHMNRRAARLPSLALKVVLFGLSTGGIAISYGTMLGVEPGMTVLIVLLALKIIETNGERDFQVLVLLGHFLCLCALFFSQELLMWLYVGVVFLLLTATLVRFHLGPATAGVARPVALSAKLLAQALPIVVVLFLFFPRTSTGFRFQFSRSLLGSGGMSDRLSPGSISSLALNEEIAFRVDFPDGTTPPISQMYWRGVVLWRGDGLTWVTGPQLPLERRTDRLAGPAIRQRISLQPHGGRWIFALDRPTGDQPRFELMPGGYLLNSRLVFNPLHYEVVSRPENHELSLPVEQMRAALAPAVRPSPQVQALVDGWRSGAANGREIVERALHHFHEEKFSYSLTPGTYGENALDDFMFSRRVGFCEHYAAAFAALMRVVGIPSRVVIGYHGGELNRMGNYVIVRQSDAHAWAEVWLQDSGWLRVDPTEVIAPDRISSGLASFLQTHGAGGEQADANDSDTAIGWRDLMRELRLGWDSVNYQWELRVLNFDEDDQRAFLAQIGLDDQWPQVAGWMAGIFAVLLGGLALWLRRPGRLQQDEAGSAWSEFCRILASAGVAREPWEGPLHYGERAAATFAAHGAAIMDVAHLYARLRYSASPPGARELTSAVRALPRLKPDTSNDRSTQPGSSN